MKNEAKMESHKVSITFRDLPDLTTESIQSKEDALEMARRFGELLPMADVYVQTFKLTQLSEEIIEAVQVGQEEES